MQMSQNTSKAANANLDCVRMFVENALFYICRSLIVKSQQNRNELVTRPAQPLKVSWGPQPILPTQETSRQSGVEKSKVWNSVKVKVSIYVFKLRIGYISSFLASTCLPEDHSPNCSLLHRSIEGCTASTSHWPVGVPKIVIVFRDSAHI